MPFSILAAESAIGVHFQSPELLVRAFTDRTAVPKDRVDECNTRLANLGDGILRAVIRDILYQRNDLNSQAIQQYEDRLGSNKVLNAFVRSQRWDEFIIIGDFDWSGEVADQRLQKREATAFEAIIGSIFIESGYNAAAEFIKRVYLSDIDAIMQNTTGVSAVTQLHEFIAKRFGRQPTRSKRIIRHGKLGQEFSYEYRFRGLSGHAIAGGKIEAKELAAQSLLDQLLAQEPPSP